MFFLPIGSNVPYSRQPWFCYAILISNLLIYLLTWLIPIERMSWFTFVPYDRAYFTSISSAFLHNGLFHLLSNMLLLYIVGLNIESRIGIWRFAFFYLLACSISTYTHGIFNNTQRLFGASGGVSALIGAYLILYTHAKIRILFFPIQFLVVMLIVFLTPSGLSVIFILFYSFFYLGAFLWSYRLNVPAYLIFLLYFGYQLRMAMVHHAAMDSGVSYWAHIGGFAFGMFFAVLFFGTGGVFRTIDGAVISSVPGFIRKYEERKIAQDIREKRIGAEGGVVFLGDTDAEKVRVIARLQNLTFTQQAAALAVEYETAKRVYPQLVLSPKAQLIMGQLFRKVYRDDLAEIAWSDLLRHFPKSPETREAGIGLVRCRHDNRRQLQPALELIQTLRREALKLQEQNELQQLEHGIQERLKEASSGFAAAPGAAMLSDDEAHDLALSFGVEFADEPDAKTVAENPAAPQAAAPQTAERFGSQPGANPAAVSAAAAAKRNVASPTATKFETSGVPEEPREAVRQASPAEKTAAAPEAPRGTVPAAAHADRMVGAENRDFRGDDAKSGAGAAGTAVKIGAPDRRTPWEREDLPPVDQAVELSKLFAGDDAAGEAAPRGPEPVREVRAEQSGRGEQSVPGAADQRPAATETAGAAGAGSSPPAAAGGTISPPDADQLDVLQANLPRQFNFPVMVLLRPDQPVRFEATVDALREFYEIHAEEAERRFRTGKGLLLKAAPPVDGERLIELLRARGCPALLTPVLHQLQFREAEEITSFNWTPGGSFCRTYSSEVEFGWGELRLLSAALLNLPGITQGVPKRVLDFYLQRDGVHLRLWEDLFNARRSTVDDRPLESTLLTPLIPLVHRRTPRVVKSKSLLKACAMDDCRPHPFRTIDEYLNYNLWMLYTHCVEWRTESV